MINVQAVIDLAQSRGSNATTFRDAVHEIVHALQCLHGDEDWSRTNVSNEYSELDGHEQVLGECIARATEWLACEGANIDYDMKSYAMITALEAIKCGIDVPLADWITGIEACKTNGQAQTFLDRIKAEIR